MGNWTRVCPAHNRLQPPEVDGLILFRLELDVNSRNKTALQGEINPVRRGVYQNETSSTTRHKLCAKTFFPDWPCRAKQSQSRVFPELELWRRCPMILYILGRNVGVRVSVSFVLCAFKVPIWGHASLSGEKCLPFIIKCPPENSGGSQY